MFFDYCILLHRPSEEFWESRPSQIIYCIEKYEEMIMAGNYEDEPKLIINNVLAMCEIAHNLKI